MRSLKLTALFIFTLLSTNLFAQQFVSDSMVTYIWDNATQQLKKRGVNTYTFNSQGNKSGLLVYSINDDNQYDTTFGQVFLKYKGDQFTLVYNFNYNQTTSQFDTTSKIQINTNINNDNIANYQIYLTDGVWENRVKDSTIYDKNNFKTKYLRFFFWDTTTKEYLPHLSETAYINDSLGNVVTLYSLNRNKTTQNLDTISKNINTYNDDNNLKQITVWVKENGTYELNGKTEYTYDASGFNTQVDYFKWDSDSSSWYLNYYRTYEKSEDKRRITENSYSINKSTNKWRNSNRTIYYLRGTNSIDQSKTLPFKIYPNPGTGKFTIALDAQEELAYQVSNTMGQTVKQGVISMKSNQIDLTAFNKGIYFIQISNGTRMGTQKVIVE